MVEFMRIYNKDSDKKKYIQEIEKFLKTSQIIHLTAEDDKQCKQKA
jgi:hypothetical protein